MIDLAVANAMKLIDERFIDGLHMSNDETRPTRMGATISATFTTVIGEHVNQAAVSDMVPNASRQTATNPGVIST